MNVECTRKRILKREIIAKLHAVLRFRGGFVSQLSIFYTNQFVTIFGRKRNRREKYLGMTHEKTNQQNNVVELFCRFECLTIFRYYQSEIIFGNDNFKQILNIPEQHV